MGLEVRDPYVRAIERLNSEKITHLQESLNVTEEVARMTIEHTQFVATLQEEHNHATTTLQEEHQHTIATLEEQHKTLIESYRVELSTANVAVLNRVDQHHEGLEKLRNELTRSIATVTLENADLLIERQKLLLFKHQQGPEGGIPGKSPASIPDYYIMKLIHF